MVRTDRQTLWAEIESKRVAFTERVTLLSKEALNHRAAPTEFTPLELIAHFAASEQAYGDLYAQTDDACRARRTGRYGLAYRMLVTSMRRAWRLPVPPGMEPKTVASLDQALRDWEAAREGIGRMTLSAPAGPAVLRHPILGPLDADQILEILAAHMIYHERRARF